MGSRYCCQSVSNASCVWDSATYLTRQRLVWCSSDASLQSCSCSHGLLSAIIQISRSLNAFNKLNVKIGILRYVAWPELRSQDFAQSLRGSIALDLERPPEGLVPAELPTPSPKILAFPTAMQYIYCVVLPVKSRAIHAIADVLLMSVCLMICKTKMSSSRLDSLPPTVASIMAAYRS